MSKQKFES